MSGRTETNWRWAFIAAFAVGALAFYPQLHFWAIKGEWSAGTYAHLEGVGDEVAYSAYVNALICGRPRLNDPYTGRDASTDRSQAESLFSIQFIPAYALALPSRALGITASTAFIWLMPLAGFASALALFWLLVSVTRQDQLSSAGAVFVLCLGTLVGGHGQVVAWFGLKPLYNYLIFLRRYQPSASFPVFFIFCALVWKALAGASKRTAIVWAICAAAAFAVLAFSYFYLWTAAAAWLGCLFALWLFARPEGWRRGLKLLSLTGVLSLCALVPYALLLSHRAQTMETVEALSVSRRLDLFRLPELIGLAVFSVLLLMARRGALVWRDKRALMAASFALMPLVVFNQQALTGRSLQPIHYEMFAANYSALLSIVLAATAIRGALQGGARLFSRRALFWIALAAFEWGAYEAFVAASGSVDFNRRLDDSAPAAHRLAEIARAEKLQPERSNILATDLLVADGLPTIAPQPLLYAPHMPVFSGATEAEAKERFYQYLYYTGIDENRLRRILTREGRYGFTAALFGFERAVAGLSDSPKPIEREELDRELRAYREYCAAFDYERAAAAGLAYLLVSDDERADLSRLDQWYERDAGESLHGFTLYRLKLKEKKDARDALAVGDACARRFSSEGLNER